MFFGGNVCTIRPAPCLLNNEGHTVMSSNQWYSNQRRILWTCKALLDERIISHKTEIREVSVWLALMTQKGCK